MKNKKLEELEKKMAKLRKKSKVEGMCPLSNLPDGKKLHTGILTLDYLLKGGMLEGAIMLLYGAPISLKTTIGLKILANLQKEEGKTCGIINTESGFDKKRFKNLGGYPELVDINIARKMGECLYDIVIEMVREGTECFLIDSVSNMVSKYSMDKKQVESQIMAEEAKMNKRALKYFMNMDEKANLILVSHLLPTLSKNGPINYTPGGYVLSYLPEYRIEMVSKNKYDSEWNKIITNTPNKPVEGIELLFKGNKIRNTNPNSFASIKINLYTGEIFLEDELFQLAKKMDLLERSGANFTIKGTQITFNGEVRFVNALIKDRELFKLLEDMVKKEIYGK